MQLLLGFVFYFMIISLIVFVSYSKNKKRDYDQVILGGRSINALLTALSAHASDMSDWLFMAFPAALYIGGLIGGWIAIGLVFGMWITWQFIAPKLRHSTEQFQSMTLSSYFENRFGDTSGMLRLLSAIMSLLFFAVYIAAGLKGFGFLAESVFGLPYTVGLLICLVCVIFYIILGGYGALAWIDCFQALFLLTVIFFVPIIGLNVIGGWNAISIASQSKNISLAILPNTWINFINTLLVSFSWAVGYFGTPHILTKFMGISDVKKVKKAKYIGLSWQISVLSAAGLVGLIGIAFFSETLANKELVFVEMVKTMFSPLAAGFILSAVAGATLSVITAQVLVLVSVITEDFYRRTFKPHATNNELLWVYRISIILIAFLSFFVSVNKSTTIQQLVHYAWMGFGCSFGPLVLLSLHSNKINKYGAFSSILVGGTIAGIWHFLGQSFILTNYAIDVPAVIPGFFLSVLSAYLVSYITEKKYL